MQLNLTPHRTTPAVGVKAIEVAVWQDGERWCFRYLVEGAGDLVLPKPQAPGRADELWRTTCFEAFIGSDSGSYTELNFAPSGRWAAYDFDAPRQGMRNSKSECEVWLEVGEDWISVEAAITGEFAKDAPMGLAAITEEADGTKSCWSLAHGSDKPDFHDPDCFVARLP